MVVVGPVGVQDAVFSLEAVEELRPGVRSEHVGGDGGDGVAGEEVEGALEDARGLAVESEDEGGVEHDSSGAATPDRFVVFAHGAERLAQSRVGFRFDGLHANKHGFESRGNRGGKQILVQYEAQGGLAAPAFAERADGLKQCEGISAVSADVVIEEDD